MLLLTPAHVYALTFADDASQMERKKVAWHSLILVTDQYGLFRLYIWFIVFATATLQTHLDNMDVSNGGWGIEIDVC